MRKDLADLEGLYLTCYATVKSVSYPKGKHEIKDILLIDICHEVSGRLEKTKYGFWWPITTSQKYLEDHVWCRFNVYDNFWGGLSLDDLEEGNCISFNARVKPYQKGAIGRKEIDYTLTDFENIEVISSY
jgi:hypothetical protein